LPEFEVNISDGKGKTTSVQAKGPAANTLIGMKIGDEVAGDVFGLPKQVLKITGGSDKSGLPMIPWLPGGAKRQIYVRKKDTREKRWVRGNTITEEVVQVNMVVVGENKPTDGSGARRGSSALLRRDDRVNNGDGRIRGVGSFEQVAGGSARPERWRSWARRSRENHPGSGVDWCLDWEAQRGDEEGYDH
jgi:small subunit ribosomal protein S6e